MKIKVTDLNYIDEGRQILKDIHLTISSKHFIGVIGPNGSGKSTFLKLLSRALQAKRGTIELGEKNINQMSYKESSQLMASLSQEQQMPFDFQVKELVMMGRYPYKRRFDTETKEDEQIVQRVMKQVGITKLQDENYQHLSGGEKQRVLIAQMLAQESKLLILDEPTNHLDISYQLELFKFLRQNESTIISAIHDLNIAATYCDYLYVLKEGELFTEGEPQEIFTEQQLQNVFNVEAEVFTHPIYQRPIIIYK